MFAKGKTLADRLAGARDERVARHYQEHISHVCSPPSPWVLTPPIQTMLEELQESLEKQMWTSYGALFPTSADNPPVQGLGFAAPYVSLKQKMKMKKK